MRFISRANWERTARALRVIERAEVEARRRGHAAVSPEHLLLGLVHAEGVALIVLANLGVTGEALASAVEAVIAVESPPGHGELLVSPAVAAVLEFADSEADRLKHRYIGTEHLLLGLLRHEEGGAARILAELGVTLDRARAETERVLAQPKAAGSGLRRYHLVLPEDLYREVEELAAREHTTVVEVLRRFIKLGLFATRVQATPGSTLLIREGDREREIVLL